MRYISKIAPPAEVEDIVQEAYVKLCQLEHTEQETMQRKNALLYVIAKNLALDHNKRAEVRLADGVNDESEYITEENDSTYNYAATHERFGHFCEVIRSMPKQCQKVFVLKKVYGFSQQEIAQELGINIKTVDSHVVNGMKLVKAHVDQSKVGTPQYKRKMVGGKYEQ